MRAAPNKRQLKKFQIESGCGNLLIDDCRLLIFEF